jgi:MFS family permease
MEHRVETGGAGSEATPGQTIGEALDEAPLSLFHLKAAVTSAMGFFTDAYDLFIIGVAITLVKSEWHLSAVQTSFLGSATLIATLVGPWSAGGSPTSSAGRACTASSP